MASINEEDSLQVVNVEERQRLKDFEDRIIDIILVLDSTYDTVLSLCDRYNQYRQDVGDKAEGFGDNGFDYLDFALQEKQRDVESNRRKVQTLRTKVQSTTELVRRYLDLV